MRNRNLLFGFVVFFILHSVAQAIDIVLENKTIKVAFNSENGAIDY